MTSDQMTDPWEHGPYSTTQSAWGFKNRVTQGHRPVANCLLAAPATCRRQHVRLPHGWPGQGHCCIPYTTKIGRGGAGVSTGEWVIHWDALSGTTSIHIAVTLSTLDASTLHTRSWKYICGRGKSHGS